MKGERVLPSENVSSQRRGPSSRDTYLRLERYLIYLSWTYPFDLLVENFLSQYTPTTLPYHIGRERKKVLSGSPDSVMASKIQKTIARQQEK